MRQDWFVKDGSEMLGPMSRAELVEFVADAEAGLSTEVRRGVDGQWLHAGSVGGLMKPEKEEREISSNASAGLGAKQLDDSAAINPYQPTALRSSDQVVSLQAHAGSGLKMTRIGLLTSYYGVCAVLIGGVGGFALSVCSYFFLSSTGAIFGVAISGLVAIGASLLGAIAFLVGQVLCLAVPIESGARGYMKIVVSLHVGWLVLAIGGTALFESMGGMGRLAFLVETLFSSLWLVPEFVGLICLVTALKKLSLYLELPDLASAASSVRRLVILLGVMGLVSIPAASLVLRSAGISGLFSLSLVLLTSLIALVTLVRFSGLLVRLARAIPRDWEGRPDQFVGVMR